jgi:hypothetical protein
MEEEKKNPKKERNNPNIVYALADYKQLVIQYRSRQAELIKSLMFWRTTALWLSAAGVICLLFSVALYTDNKKQAAASASGLAAMSSRIESLTERFEGREQELTAAREEIEAKSARISQLEKNLSTASKKQAEKLLKDVEAK